MGDITVAEGRVQEGNFDKYPVARTNRFGELLLRAALESR
jgi:hypothetical protein